MIFSKGLGLWSTYPIESINVPDSDLEALNDILIRRAEFPNN